MNIFNYFKKNGIDTVDKTFYRKIEEWISWYNANVRRFTFYKVYTGRGTYKKCQRKSMNMAKKLSEDIADLLLNERVTITLSDDDTDKFVHSVLENNRFLVMANDYQERKAYTGTAAYIPYLDNTEVDEEGNVLSGEIRINYVDAPNIYPVSWNNGRITECVFSFPHTVSGKKYVHLQSHFLKNGEYVIKNAVLTCDSDLNYLSMKCGFGTDRYQFGTSGVKTATEIISENSDMYRMIKKHEIILEDALKQLIRIIIRLGIVTGNSLNLDTEIVINFDDSIIEDKDTERKRDLQDLSAGIMSHAEYRAKWYGETIEEAEKNLPEQSQVME